LNAAFFRLRAAHRRADGRARSHSQKQLDLKQPVVKLFFKFLQHFTLYRTDAAFTSLRHSQEQLAASQSALHQAQKMVAIGSSGSVYRSGKPFVGRSLHAFLQRVPGGSAPA
jgi:hypothetical protein